MIKIIYIFLLIALGITELNSQSIFIKRSDVDSARSGFITATYTFTIDVYIKDLPNTNGVAFELDYSLSNFVKFSQWKIGDYSPPQVVAFEDTSGNGRLIVAVGTGDKTQPDSNITPKVISLEFVTLQNAQNNLVNIFKFIKPVATAIDSAGRKLVFLNSDTIAYNIHGFVDVWPGDTDNSGIVDHLDFAPVTQYVGLGSSTKNMKSFKRKSGSAIWGPHRVLTWDSAAVTYADCDGNGDITMSDMLIVTYNLGKNKSSSINKINDEIQSKLPKPTYYSNQNSSRIPLQLDQNINLYAIVGEIDISNFDGKVLGVEPGDIFTDYPFNYSVIKDNKLHFALGTYTKQLSLDNGIIGNIVVDENVNMPILNYITELKGIDKYGNILDLNIVSSVEDNQEKETHIENNKVNFNTLTDKVLVYDLLGTCIYQYSSIEYINTQNWKSGIYFIQYSQSNSSKTIKYLKSN